MKVTAETKFHSWLFGLLAALVVASVSSLKLLEELSWVHPTILFGATFFLGVVGYSLIAQAILSTAHSQPWLLRFLLGKKYIQGFWIGVITGSSGNHSFAIERYDQSMAGVEVTGESWWPDGTLAARWETTIAFVDPQRDRIYALFSSTIYSDRGDIHRISRGSGYFRFDKDHLYGECVDIPVRVEVGGHEKFISKTFHYNLERLTDRSVDSFAAVKQTDEWNRLMSPSPDLDDLAGSWSAAEAAEFDQALAEQRTTESDEVKYG